LYRLTLRAKLMMLCADGRSAAITPHGSKRAYSDACTIVRSQAG
jgi:hypothetical protein